jgi:hypothetical protein
MVAALDQADLAISVAMWLYPQEYEDWRFVLASRRLDEAGPRDAYGLVHDALTAAGISYRQTPTLMILEMKDPFIRELRRTFGKAKFVEGMRLGLQMIGDRFVEDGIVYRIK